jgi:hypothetical protein
MQAVNYTLSEKLLEAKRTLLQLSLNHWFNYELFTWQWWGKFIYLGIPMILFYKLLDRKRILEIVSYGLIISLLSTISDTTGTGFVLWEYPIRLMPIGFFAVHDLAIVPIISMLVYQFCSSWKSFIIFNVILSAIASFIIEPLYIWINIYKPIEWKHIYSFFSYLLMAVLCKLIINKLIKYYQKAMFN